MTENKQNDFSVTRARVRRKPKLQQPSLNFYQIGDSITVSVTPIPLTNVPNLVRPLSIQKETEPTHQLKYEIFGGFNNNAISVDLNTDALKAEKHEIDWVGLMTFTGFQFKYVAPTKKKLIFSLADEDAYVYCDKDPCEECVFKCKNGFRLYVHCRQHGLFCTEISPRNVINKTH